MGPKQRNGNRAVPYDLSLPDNWTANKLKQELSKLGVTVPSTARKAQLIALFKEHSSTASHRPIVDQSAMTETTLGRMENSPTQNASGVVNNQDGVLSAISNLSDTIYTRLSDSLSEIREEMQRMQSRIHTLEGNRIPAAAAGSVRQSARDSTMPSHMEFPVQESGVTFDSETILNTERGNANRYTLRTAIDAHSRPSTSEGVTPGNPDNSSTFVRTHYGYSAESLPFVEVISPSLRRNITEGKDINLAALLIPYYTGPSTSGNGSFEQKPDARLLKQLTIGEFIQAFGIYKHIMCQTFPSRREELDLYERDIIDMASRYGGAGFYEYHKQFSAKAAAYLAYQNIRVDWSIRNNALFCNIFANLKPVSCNICHSVSHKAGFCPQASSHSQQQQRQSNIDKHGRVKKFHQGKEICNNFNDKGCNRFHCHNLHVCFVCQKDHSKRDCTSQDVNSKNDSAPRNLHKRGNQ